MIVSLPHAHGNAARHVVDDRDVEGGVGSTNR